MKKKEKEKEKPKGVAIYPKTHEILGIVKEEECRPYKDIVHSMAEMYLEAKQYEAAYEN